MMTWFIALSIPSLMNGRHFGRARWRRVAWSRPAQRVIESLFSSLTFEGNHQG